jgi:hypothetical protein
LNINELSLAYNGKTSEIWILLFLACDEAKSFVNPDNRKRPWIGSEADAKIGNSEAQAALRRILWRTPIV